MLSKSDIERAVIYIDGSNLYFSLKRFNFKIDLEKFCKKLIGNSNLIKINYYIAPVDITSNPKEYSKQQKFFNKLKKIKNLNIIFGRLEKRKKGNILYYIEKASDVNLALDLVLDAQKDIYAKAFLVSNDGDFSTAVSSAINFGKEVIYVAVGNRKSFSHHLNKVATTTIKINKEFISDLELI